MPWIFGNCVVEDPCGIPTRGLLTTAAPTQTPEQIKILLYNAPLLKKYQSRFVYKNMSNFVDMIKEVHEDWSKLHYLSDMILFTYDHKKGKYVDQILNDGSKITISSWFFNFRQILPHMDSSFDKSIPDVIIDQFAVWVSILNQLFL